MRIENYEITIKKIIDHKFNVGDVVRVNRNSGRHDGKIGIIVTVKDFKWKHWFYLVEYYDNCRIIEPEEDLTLIITKKRLLANMEGYYH